MVMLYSNVSHCLILVAKLYITKRSGIFECFFLQTKHQLFLVTRECLRVTVSMATLSDCTVDGVLVGSVIQ
jgi:hypothetical protein